MKKVIFFSSLVLLFACERREGDRFEGTYYCRVAYQQSDQYSTTYDTSYCTMSVNRKGKMLRVGGYLVPVSEVVDQQKAMYDKDKPSGFLQFINDSLYLSESYGFGKGGVGQSKTACSKLH